jgi:hypothetical protein
MNTYRVLAACLILASANVVAVSFEDLFNANRALHGKGYHFMFEGNSYVTDHPEEIEAQGEANLDNAKALLISANNMHKKAKSLGYGWTLTAKIIKSAQKALKKGQYQHVMNLSAQAKYHARMGIAQYHASASDWNRFVPK